MREINAVCVYCGSSSGRDPAYTALAQSLGELLAAEDVTLVYGGGDVGLMGTLADAVVRSGGRVTGVIPRGLFSREVAHRGLGDLREVATMHERKQLMFDLSDAFVALPGGLGTLEELSEIATWAQLGLHRKPIAVLDGSGYWRPLFDLLDTAVREGFMKPANRELIARVEDLPALFDALREYDVALEEKWLTRDDV